MNNATLVTQTVSEWIDQLRNDLVLQGVPEEAADAVAHALREVIGAAADIEGWRNWERQARIVTACLWDSSWPLYSAVIRMTEGDGADD